MQVQGLKNRQPLVVDEWQISNRHEPAQVWLVAVLLSACTDHEDSFVCPD